MDNSKYRFKNKIYGKCRLVEAVVRDYIFSHRSITFEELKKQFPDKLQFEHTHITIAKYDVFREIHDIDKSISGRYFSEEIKLADEKIIRINRGWDKDNILDFIQRASELNYIIEKI